MSSHKTICVFTGSRAEYGLLVPILRRIDQAADLDLQLVVSGSHLSQLHGHTIDQIREDGFRIDAVVEVLLASDTAVAATKSIGLGLLDLAVQLERLRPDLMILLGDRYELMSAALASLMRNIPIAHVHGGEITEGAFDDNIRHALSKLAHLHFAAAEEFARRLVQMGESPERVFVVGAPGIDTIREMTPLGREQLEARLGHELRDPLALAVYHPVTLPGEDPETAMANILSALEDHPGSVVVGLPNADPQYATIRKMVLDATRQRPEVHALSSIGHHAFLSLMSVAAVMVGNSSASVIEAPSLRLPAVLVGGRQTGRPLARSVITSGTAAEEIAAAIRTALTEEFRTAPGRFDSPYDRGVSAATEIVRVLEQVDATSLLRKRFYSTAE